MIAYTKAPWQISKGDYGISRIYSTTEDGAPFYVASEIVRDDDARLIRLAPQMYEALQTIAAMSGMTLIGGSDLEADRAHELGANKAFEQAAEIARAALVKSVLS
jgi:hypothetical protein